MSGRHYQQGEYNDCNSQSENETENGNDALPDLPTVVDPTLLSIPLLPTKETSAVTLKTLISGNNSTHTSTGPLMTTKQSTTTITNSISMCSNVPKSGNTSSTIELISLPAIERQTHAPQTAPKAVHRSLGDLLCTLNFDKVTTDPVPQNTSDTGRKVVTISLEDSSPSDDSVCKVVMKPLTDTSTNNLLDPTGCLTINETTARKVVTNNENPDQPAVSNDSDMTLPAEDSSLTGAESQLGSTPHSVVTNPDAAELETANVLLQLGNIPNNLDAEYDNSELLPVDAEPLEDFTRNLRQQEADRAADHATVPP